MADISKIKLPGDNTEYNIKDSTARAQSGVTGVKGNAESSYRTGQVNLTPANIGAVAKSGDTMTGNLVVPKTRIANTYYGVSFGRTTGTPVETILYTGIKWVNGAHMPVIHVTGYAYGLQSPVEFKIAFYIYGNKIGWCGATNMGSWNPSIKLFKHTVDSVDYVAVGFSGSCYFLQLQVDVQDEMGKFLYTDLTSSLWSWSFLTTAGTIPEADGGVTCIAVPYKADILVPNMANASGTLPISHGGTGATTAEGAANAIFGGLPAWTADPTDNTYLPRQDTGGGASYGKVKFSTVWNYIKSKLSGIGYGEGYIRTQPENTLPVIIPFVTNDIAFLLKRGGSAVVKYDGVVQDVSIASVFDGSPSYWGITSTGITEVVIELTLHKVFTRGNTLYIDFGPWYTKTIKVEVMRSDATYPNDVWTEKFSTTTNTNGYITANVTHTPVGASNSAGGFNKVRLTFSFANGAYSGSTFRIAQIGILNYGSLGLRETYMSRGIDDLVFRSITPGYTASYNLGSSSLRWSNVYGNTVHTNRLIGTVQVGDSTQSAIANAGIRVNDVRNATLTNNIIDNAANFYFMLSGMPGNKWKSILHVKGWTGGYSAWELAGPANNSDERTEPLYVRTGSSTNTWGDWRKILDASMLSSATNSSSEDLAATPKAVKAAYDLATTANTNAGSAMSAATGAYVLTVTYAISNGTVTCSAHVYSAGSEVTSTFADSCFTWSYNTGAGWVATSTHAKTYTPSVLSAFGGSVKCDFTPPSN